LKGTQNLFLGFSFFSIIFPFLDGFKNLKKIKINKKKAQTQQKIQTVSWAC